MGVGVWRHCQTCYGIKIGESLELSNWIRRFEVATIKHGELQKRYWDRDYLH